MKGYSFRDEISEVCSQSGLISPDAASWIADILENNMYASPSIIERLIRHLGNPIDLAMKRRLGIRQNAKLGDIYVSALTDAGKRRAMLAAFIVVRRLIHARSLRARLDEWRQKPTISEVKILASKGDRACRAVRMVDDVKYPIDQVPSLPLAKCTADFCSCFYSAVIYEGENVKPEG